MLKLILSFILLISISQCKSQSLVEGFENELFISGFELPVGIMFFDEEKAFVWELGGKIWLIEEGEKIEPPVIDISEEVGYYGDFGLIGLALDPEFMNNGLMYLLYSVDQHYLLNYVGIFLDLPSMIMGTIISNFSEVSHMANKRVCYKL